jgi:hypothetical protein
MLIGRGHTPSYSHMRKREEMEERMREQMRMWMGETISHSSTQIRPKSRIEVKTTINTSQPKALSSKAETIKEYKIPNSGYLSSTKTDVRDRGILRRTYSTEVKDAQGFVKHKVDFPQRHKPNQIPSLEDMAIAKVADNIQDFHPTVPLTIPPEHNKKLLEKLVDSGQSDIAANILRTKFAFQRIASMFTSRITK